MSAVLHCQAIAKLAECGVKMIAMRCAGYDRVDLEACEKHGIKVVRVPTYSPNSVAEHAVGLLFAVNRYARNLALYPGAAT
jgi:D-lactate dehydrogenase